MNADNTNNTSSNSTNTDESEDATSGDTDESEENPLLDEFIALLCSDTEYITELEEYYKNEFNKWLNGESYQFITIGADGHLVMPDYDARYFGKWDNYDHDIARIGDSYIQINPDNDKQYHITIYTLETGDADNNYHPYYFGSYSLKGIYDEAAGVIQCNGRYYYHDYNIENDEEELKVVDIEGSIWIDDDDLGLLHWNIGYMMTDYDGYSHWANINDPSGYIKTSTVLRY